MKRIITVLLALLLVLLPQSALAVHGGLLCSPEAVSLESKENIGAIEELLLGIDYKNEEIHVSDWTDEELGDVMYAKLLEDFYRDGEATCLEKIGIEYRIDDMGDCFVDLALLQRVTKEAFGLDFPEDISLNWLYVMGNEVAFKMASGEFEELSVQECIRIGDTVLAVGTAIRYYGVGSEFKGHFLAHLQEAPGSVYGYRLISVKPIEDSHTLQNLTAEASSELVETKTTHRATNVLDNDRTTAWCESVDGVGVGEWIMLQTVDGSKMHISAIEFLLGYHKSEEHLDKNGTPWEVLIEAEDGYAQRVSFSDIEDSILLKNAVKTQWLKITILDASAGSKYEDTCITEIQLHGIDAEPHFRQYIADLPVEDTTEPTEPEATEPTSTEAEVTEPTATEPEETETSEDKKFFWELDKEDLSEDDPMEEDRKEEPEDDQTTTLLLVAVIAAAVVIVALLVVLIIVVIKKKK